MVDRKQHSPEQILALLQSAIRDAPEFVYQEQLSENDIRWLGRSYALLEISGEISTRVNFDTARKALNTYNHDRQNLLMPLYDALSRMELLVPASLQGAFIPAGDTWDGYAALVKLVQTSSDDILIVDPYLNSDIFLHFAPHSVSNKGIRCLTAKRSSNHSELLATNDKWQADEISKAHPVEIRYATASELHDRLIVLDSKEVWLVSQSIKDIAKRSPASVTRADAELGLMKIEHYEAIWEQSAKIA